MAPSVRSRRLTVLAAAAVFCALAAAVMYFHYPILMRYFPPCPFFKLTRLYCPGCGSTRATYHLLHGNMAGVFRCNALYIPCLLFVLVLLLRPRLAKQPLVSAGFLAVVLAFWILRNLPWAPFTLLVPGAL
jgi:hypothetical protein